MRWFKHITESHNDEKLASLIAQHGLEAYGFWWMLIELIAKQTDKDKSQYSVSYPLSYWVRITGVYHHKKFRTFIEFLNNLSLISATSMNNVCNISAISMKDVLTISIPNLLKYRDEYTKKSRQDPDNVRAKKQRQNIEADIKPKTFKSSSVVNNPGEDDFSAESETLLLPKISLFEFRDLFEKATGNLMPAGCNNEANNRCHQFSKEKIEEAFRLTAVRGGKTFNYFDSILQDKIDAKPYKKPVSQPKTFAQMRDENNLNAAIEFAGIGVLRDDRQRQGEVFTGDGDSCSSFLAGNQQGKPSSLLQISGLPEHRGG